MKSEKVKTGKAYALPIFYGDEKDFSVFGKKTGTLAPQARNRKKVVATASRHEGVYNQAGEPSGTFCGKGAAVRQAKP